MSAVSPRKAWQVTNALQGCLADGGHSLATIPDLLLRIINQGLWVDLYCEPTQEEVHFTSFAEYVTAALPEGLGTDIRTLKNLCRDHPAVLDAIDRECKQDPGAPEGNKNAAKDRGSTVNNVNGCARPLGNSRDAALRRLRKDRPDLHEQVLQNQLSAHAAMVQAGFRKKPTPDEAAVKAFRKAENRLVVINAILPDLEAYERQQIIRMVQEYENG